jgi:hypothetical protein
VGVFNDLQGNEETNWAGALKSRNDCLEAIGHDRLAVIILVSVARNRGSNLQGQRKLAFLLVGAFRFIPRGSIKLAAMWTGQASD